MSPADTWPLRHLVLRTPRLELRPDDDAGLLELAEEARRGVHDPATMPFVAPWTDTPPDQLGRKLVQYHWGERAALRPEHWSISFLVRFDGVVIGNQGMSGRDFAITREVHTGSWIGRRLHGRGLGTEMRAAVLLFAFDHLGAEVAHSAALADNHASHGVSRKLGYRPNGTATVPRRGVRTVDVRLALARADLVRPQWTLTVEGFDAQCRALLGAG